MNGWQPPSPNHYQNLLRAFEFSPSPRFVYLSIKCRRRLVNDMRHRYPWRCDELYDKGNVHLQSGWIWEEGGKETILKSLVECQCCLHPGLELLKTKPQWRCVRNYVGFKGTIGIVSLGGCLKQTQCICRLLCYNLIWE